MRKHAERVALSGSKCHSSLGSYLCGGVAASKPQEIIYVPSVNSFSPLAASHRIQGYIAKFIQQNVRGKYIAVMLRLHKMKQSMLSIPLQNNSCFQGIISDWKEAKEGRNITQTLFFSDIGKHGSVERGRKYADATRFSTGVHDAVNVHLSLDKMNSILEKITGSQNSVQIAILHQQLVAHATCVVVVGGGSFQAQTLYMYAHLHKGKECYVVRDGDCEKQYITQICGEKI